MKKFNLLRIKNSSSQIHDGRGLSNTYERVYDAHAVIESVALSVGEGGDSVGVAELDALKLAGLMPKSRLFDFGCGTGRLAKFSIPFLEDGKYFGSDISSEMLRIFRNEISVQKDQKLFHQISFEFPKIEGGVDFIAAFSVFTHMEPEDTLSYLKAMHSISGESTKLVVSILDIDSKLGQLVFQNQAAIAFEERWRAVRNFVTSKDYFTSIAHLAGWELSYWLTDDNQEFQGPANPTSSYKFGQCIAVFSPVSHFNNS
jgi:SAM-dependent methyltransferase